MKRKLSVWDFIIIAAVILALCAGGFIYLHKKNKAAFVAKTPIEFDLLALNLTAQQVDSLEQKIGKSVIFGKTNIDTGVLKDVQIQPYKILVKDILNGEFKWVEHPENFQAVFTIEKNVLQTNDVFMGEKEEIRIGELTPFKGKGFGCADCYVIDLRVKGEK